MKRFISLTDAQWEKMWRFCLGKPTDPGRMGGDARLFTEAVLWIARTGSPWRDLPPMFGKWNTVFKRFRDWVKARHRGLAKVDWQFTFAMAAYTLVRLPKLLGAATP